MTTNEAYRLFWLRGLDAHQQTSREAFWKAFLANIFIYIVLSAFSFGVLGLCYLVAIFIPKITMVSRRLINAGLSQVTAEGLVGAEAIWSMGLAILTFPLAFCDIQVFDLCAGLLIAYKLVLLIFCAMPSARK